MWPESKAENSAEREEGQGPDTEPKAQLYDPHKHTFRSVSQVAPKLIKLIQQSLTPIIAKQIMV